MMSRIYHSQNIHFAALLLSVISLCQCLKDRNFVCEKVNACQCVFPVGVGIDLTGLEDSTKSPWIKGTGNNVTLFFKPCSNFPFPYADDNNECSVAGAALCAYNSTLKAYKLLGKVEEASFDSRSIADPIHLKYNYQGISTAIELKCGGEQEPTSLDIDPSSTSTSYILTLKSSSLCLKKMDVIDHSLSTGSVLVIIFFTFSAIYFAGGALAMKLMRGAEGKELIPNYDFWSDLPLLVKDGASYALSGFQTIPSYDRI